ncbi:hypothetical protein ACP70R_019405 [Stipagrostis hirtigluma subsp. patula]
MASPKRSAMSSLLHLVLILAVAQSGLALELEALFDGTGHLPPLLDCSPARAASSDSQNDSAFRDKVLSVLGAIPSAAAAAPSGFAAMWSDGAGRDRASASASARAAATAPRACPPQPRTSPSAFRGWLYDDGGPTAAPPEAQCSGDRTPAECSRCANESARMVPVLKLAHRVSTFYGEAVVVVGYDCCLRVQLVPPPPRWLRVVGHIALAVDVIVIVGGLVFCIKKACDPA